MQASYFDLVRSGQLTNPIALTSIQSSDQPTRLRIIQDFNYNLTPSHVKNTIIYRPMEIFSIFPSAADLVAANPDAKVGDGYFLYLVVQDHEFGEVLLEPGNGVQLIGLVFGRRISAASFYWQFTNVTPGQEAVTLVRLSGSNF